MSTISKKLLLSGLDHWTRLYTIVASLDGHAFSRLEWLVLSILPIICIIDLLLASRKSSKKDSYKVSPDAARALSVIFTPSSGGWSSHLTTYFRRTRTRAPSQSIQLDLSELLGNIFAGNIELRDTRDLSNLLQGSLWIYGFSITLSVKSHWWFIAAKWMVLQQFRMSPIRKELSLSNLYDSDVRVPQEAASHSDDFTYDLDHIPCHRIEREVLRIQRTHLSGITFSIEVTCFAPGITIFSPFYILCLMPFLYAPRSQLNRRKFPSTLSLQKVIGWLSKDYAIILSAKNISSEQAAILCGQDRDLIYNCNLRNRLISDEGLVEWRRKRFMLLWEAGLLSAGLLFRWRIILKAK